MYNTCCDCLGFLYSVVFQAYKGDYNNILLIKQSEHEIMLTFKHRKKFWEKDWLKELQNFYSMRHIFCSLPAVFCTLNLLSDTKIKAPRAHTER